MLTQLGILREIADNEIELMLAWRNEPAVRANMYTQHEISLHEHLAWWERTRDRADQKYFMYEFAGNAGGIAALTDIDINNKNSTWAFYSSPTAPTGTGSKMEFLILEHAFNELKLEKLYCEVLAFNTPVIKLHHKFGFITEGVFRKQYNLNGTLIDVYRLGILASEWQELRETIQEKLTRNTRVQK